MSNLTSLVSIKFGQYCFGGYVKNGDMYGGASSFSLTGIIEWMNWEIDLLQLQSVKLGNSAFRNTKSFEMSNLTSLVSIDFGQDCFNSASSFSLIGIIEWMNWEIDLPLLRSVKLGYSAFRNTGSFAMSNITSLQSIDIGVYWFIPASSFSLTGIVEWMNWEIDLPLLQSVKLNNNAFRNTGSFAMSNLTSLVSIEFGKYCFVSASSFSLTGIIEWMKWEIDLPLLQSVKLGNEAFQYTESFAMSNLTSLVSTEFGKYCFVSASSFSLTGIIEWMKWEIDLPLLQSVKLGNEAFQYTESFAMSNLTSLVSTEFGKYCFVSASSFSLTGIIEWMKWEIDLPLLQSVKLGDWAFSGDSNRKTNDEYPYNYNNTMIMKSDSNWLKEYIDLPSLISFVGEGSENYHYFGSVVFESVFSLALLSRYSFTAIQQYSVVEFLLYLFASFFKFIIFILLMIRCQWASRLYQFRTTGSII